MAVPADVALHEKLPEQLKQYLVTSKPRCHRDHYLHSES